MSALVESALANFAWTCFTNLHRHVKVQGSEKHPYDVIYTNHDEEAVRGWHCSCKAFQFGKGKYCKHIDYVQKNWHFCEWNAILDKDDEPHLVREPSEFCCPECMGPVIPIKVG